MSRPSRLAILALLAGAGGCGDRADPAPPPRPTTGVAVAAAGAGPRRRHRGAGRAAQERLARRMALALADPGFRAYVKGRARSLDGASSTSSTSSAAWRPWRRAAARHWPRAAREVRSRRSTPDAGARRRRSRSTCRCRRTAQPGSGGDDMLVATAREDHEAPVAFDMRGRRRVLERRRTARHAGAGHRAGGDRLRRRPRMGIMLPEDGGGGGGAAAGTRHRPDAGAVHDGVPLRPGF